MQKRTDQQYLLTQQYRNASNLLARITLHERFSTNPYDWFEWVFDHINLPGKANIIEIGCGSGYLWKNNVARIPPAWTITLTDLSPGMLEETQRNLANIPHKLEYVVVDAQQFPALNCQFEVVIANHMIYHIPDRAKAISEFHRVLKPNGILYCATNGENHLIELESLFDYLLPTKFGNVMIGSSSAFTLENGVQQLSPWFHVERLYYSDALRITEAEPLAAYMLSLIPEQIQFISQKQIDRLHRELNDRISRDGFIQISKSTGLIIAYKTTP